MWKKLKKINSFMELIFALAAMKIDPSLVMVVWETKDKILHICPGNETDKILENKESEINYFTIWQLEKEV